MNRLFTTAAVLGSLAAPALAQSNLGWLRDAPAASFSKADIQLMVDTLHGALDSQADGKPVTWENAAAGNSGSITPAKDPKGRAACRLARIQNRHKAALATTDAVFCKDGGQWKYTPG